MKKKKASKRIKIHTLTNFQKGENGIGCLSQWYSTGLAQTRL